MYDKLKMKLRFLGPLLASGRILLYDISFFSPVRTILSVYVSDSGRIRFAAGASGNQDVDEAIAKSLLEMYQAYVLMANITDERAKTLIDIDDPITRGYLTHNCQETVNKFISIYHLKKQRAASLPRKVNFRMNFWREPVFFHQRKITFTNKTLFYCVMKSIHGFKTISLNEKYTTVNSAAARRYGYEHQLNSGPVPFA